jgi:polyhydroxybutyrate depolymerase
MSIVVACSAGGGKAKPAESWEPEAGQSRLSMEYGGMQREILVVLPDGFDRAVSYPVVFGFHGAMRDPDDWVDWLGEVADKHDFIGIYPTGIKHTWEAVVDGRQVDDVGFVGYLGAWADSVMTVDQFRRYAVGYSAGGFLVHQLGCRATGITGIASIAGEFSSGQPFQPVKPPRKVFICHGVNDKLIPYEGGISDQGYSYQPVEQTAHKWSLAMACDQSPASSSLTDRVTEIRYSPCRGAGEVLLLKVDAGHHPQEAVDGLFTMIWDFWESGW